MIQKKIIQAIAGLSATSQIRSVFEDLNFLNLEGVDNYTTRTFVYKSLAGENLQNRVSAYDSSYDARRN